MNERTNGLPPYGTGTVQVQGSHLHPRKNQKKQNKTPPTVVGVRPYLPPKCRVLSRGDGFWGLSIMPMTWRIDAKQHTNLPAPHT